MLLNPANPKEEEVVNNLKDYFDIYIIPMLNVDGVTGGFNFQACWSGGHIAGEAAARDAGS